MLGFYEGLIMQHVAEPSCFSAHWIIIHHSINTQVINRPGQEFVGQFTWSEMAAGRRKIPSEGFHLGKMGTWLGVLPVWKQAEHMPQQTCSCHAFWILEGDMVGLDCLLIARVITV